MPNHDRANAFIGPCMRFDQYFVIFQGIVSFLTSPWKQRVESCWWKQKFFLCEKRRFGVGLVPFATWNNLFWSCMDHDQSPWRHLFIFIIIFLSPHRGYQFNKSITTRSNWKVSLTDGFSSFTISVFLLSVFLPGLFYKWIQETTSGYSAGLDFKKRNGNKRYYSAEILSPAKHKRCTGCCSRGMQHLLTWIATLTSREGLALSDLSPSLKFSILFYLASIWH